jgi:hypothetical protein
MVRQAIVWSSAILLCLAICTRVLAQDETSSGDTNLVPAVPEATNPPPIVPSAEAVASATPASMPCASACPTSASSIDRSDHSTGWLILGIGGSIGASSVALGASLMVQAQSYEETRLGSATLAAGITGVAISLLVGLIAM